MARGEMVRYMAENHIENRMISEVLTDLVMYSEAKFRQVMNTYLKEL